MEGYRELSIDFPDKYRSLRRQVHQFAAEVLRPAGMAIDGQTGPLEIVAAGSPLRRALGQAYRRGYHAAAIPEHLGGMGLSGLGAHVLMEELGWGSADIALGLAGSAIPFIAAVNDGRPELVDKFVTPFAANKDGSLIGCWALSEPRHGSDAFFLGGEEFRHPTSSGQVLARVDGDDYVVNGEKAAWISNGTIATHALCSITIEGSKGMAAHELAIIPLDLPGVFKGEPLRKLGERGLNQGSIGFRDVRIPRSHALRAQGFELDVARLLTMASSWMSAIFTGVARAAYEEAIGYSKQRVQGGKPIHEHQLVQKHLFDMFTQVEACRALSRATMIYNWEAREPSLENAIAAKIFCTQTAFDVSNLAMQLFGGMGISAGHLVEKCFRDARVSLIQQGVNEVLSLAGALRILQ